MKERGISHRNKRGAVYEKANPTLLYQLFLEVLLSASPVTTQTNKTESNPSKSGGLWNAERNAIITVAQLWEGSEFSVVWALQAASAHHVYRTGAWHTSSYACLKWVRITFAESFIWDATWNDVFTFQISNHEVKYIYSNPFFTVYGMGNTSWLPKGRYFLSWMKPHVFIHKYKRRVTKQRWTLKGKNAFLTSSSYK